MIASRSSPIGQRPISVSATAITTSKGNRLTEILRRPITLASASAAFYLLMAWALAFHARIAIDDDLSRTANAFYVLYSRQPHLAAIGFVWNPLPSFLELPVIGALRPFGLAYFAGPVMSAIWAAINVVLLKRIVNQIGLHGWICACLVAFYALNPFVIFYAADGMSESLFMLVILLQTTSMLSWCESRSPASLLASGIACGLGFGIRYESITLAGAGLFTVVLVWWLKYRGNYERLEGEALAFIVPFVYVAGLWMFANWLIMGSPIYFQNGAGSNAAQVQYVIQSGMDPGLAKMYHHLGAAIQFFAAHCLYFMPALLPLLGASLVIYGLQRRILALVPLLFPGSVLVIHLYLLYAGQSFGFLRYYFYSIPLGIIAAALLLKAVPDFRRGWRRAARGVTIAVILSATAVSIPSTLHAMSTPTVGLQEHGPLEALRGLNTTAAQTFQWRADHAMARYIDGMHLPDGSVVTDTTHSFAILLFSHNSKQFIVPSDLDFGATVALLSQFRGGYVLASSLINPQSVLLNDLYPGLMTNSEPWAHLVHRVGHWMLYKIEQPRG